MAEGQRGRPKKHLADEHHFHAENGLPLAGESPFDDDDIQENSPVEDKIQELMDTDKLTKQFTGWTPIDSDIILDHPPRNGMPVRLSEGGGGKEILAYWKKTRAFANITKRWVEQGKWVDFMTGQDVPFQPNFWRSRYDTV